MHGKGVYHYTERGHSYDGDFYLGKKEGFGEFTSSSGHVYKGEFVDDQKHGSGYYKFSDGSEYTGLFS